MKKRLAASTLIESIVALMIIMLVFGIIMNFYSRHINGMSKINKLDIYFSLTKFIESEDSSQLYENEENLYLLNYECIDTCTNKVVLQKRKVLLKIE